MGLAAEKRQSGELRGKVQDLLKNANQVIVDKNQEVKLCLTALLAGGHLLIEDRPGMGKTSLLKTLGKLLGLRSQRIQFTNDLLPADIIGTQIFNRQTNSFEFHHGPCLPILSLPTKLIAPRQKTQSACLQAMEEFQVNADGHTL